MMKRPAVVSTAMCYCASLMCLTFKEPILQLRLDKSNMPMWAIGVIFSLDTISYTITSFLLMCIKESNKNFSKLVLWGSWIFVVSMLLCGPVQFLPSKIWIICVGILIGGVGGAFVNNNCIPALVQIDKTQNTNTISAINTGAFGLGSILGPILASLLDSNFSFEWSFVSCAILVLITAVFHCFILITGPKYTEIKPEKSDAITQAYVFSESPQQNDNEFERVI